MKIAKKLLCRNAGMIFLRVSVTDIAPDSILSLDVSNSISKHSPGNLFVQNEKEPNGPHTKECIVCLPDFRILQTITISELSPTGTVLTKANLKLPAKLPTLESKANYLLRRSEAYSIREADKEHFDEKARFHLIGLLISPARWVLRGRIQIPDPSVRDIGLSVLNLDGCPLGKPVRLEDPSFAQAFHGDDEPYPSFSFSVDIPPESKGVCLVVKSSQNPSVDSFYVAYESQLRQLHDAFINTITSAGSDRSYAKWFEEHRADSATLARQRNRKFAHDAKFSIVVPLYNSPIQPFRAMVESVFAQSYQNWELILVNSTPANGELSKAVNEFAAYDKRVKPITLDSNLGIAGNTNKGIEASSGEFVCFLDHDDLIEPDILFEYASALEKDPDIKLLYCDEDVLENEELVRPHFKPEFSIDHLRCNNYICHMLTIERRMLIDVGMVPLDYDGAQDHALTLKITERTRHICHVPKMLYHWRVVAGSVAADPDAKPYAGPSGVRAVQHHLDRLGISATVEEYGNIPFTYRVHYAPPANAKVSIVIPSRDGLKVLKKCIESILSSKNDVAYEIVLIENNSQDPELFKFYQSLTSKVEETQIKVVTWKGNGFNFSSLVNFGVANSSGDYILLLNNDTEITHDHWLDELVGMASRDEVGAVGAKLLYPDMTHQHTGLAIIGDGVSMLLQNVPSDPDDAPSWCYFYYEKLTRNVSAVTGACLMVRKTSFEEVGGFDEELAVAFNDADFCLKLIDKGYVNVYTPNVTLLHHESYTRERDSRTTQCDNSEVLEHKQRFLEELHRFQLKWVDFYASGDPYHNPNFAKYGIGNQYYKLGGLDTMFP